MKLTDFPSFFLSFFFFFFVEKDFVPTDFHLVYK